MRSINKITLIGNVGKDPEIRFTKSGEPIASFSLATSESWKDAAGQTLERTEWHRIEAFGGIAQIAKDFVKKGNPIYIEGAVKYEEFTDKEGVKRNVTKIVLGKYNSRLMMLGNKPTPTDIKEELQAELEAVA